VKKEATDRETLVLNDSLLKKKGSSEQKRIDQPSELARKLREARKSNKKRRAAASSAFAGKKKSVGEGGSHRGRTWSREIGAKKKKKKRGKAV